jgi:hypothetical protein
VLQEYENKELTKRNSLNNHSPPYFDAAVANGPGCNITVLLLYNRIRPLAAEMPERFSRYRSNELTEVAIDFLYQ